MNQSTYINQRIEDYLKTNKVCNKKLLAQLTLYIFSLESKDNQNDLYILAKKLPIEDLINVISYFDGDTLKLPTKEQFFHAYITATAMYLKEIIELDWKEIKEILSLPEKEKDKLSSISIGRRINSIKEEFTNDIHKILNSIEADEDKIKEMKNEVEDGLNG